MEGGNGSVVPIDKFLQKAMKKSMARKGRRAVAARHLASRRLRWFAGSVGNTGHLEGKTSFLKPPWGYLYLYCQEPPHRLNDSVLLLFLDSGVGSRAD